MYIHIFIKLQLKILVYTIYLLLNEIYYYVHVEEDFSDLMDINNGHLQWN